MVKEDISLHLEALLVTLLLGFLLMRLYRSLFLNLHSVLITAWIRIPLQILILLSADAGWLVSTLHQSQQEFLTYHWPVLMVILGELVLWEPVAFVGQSVYCYVCVK